VFPLFKQNLNGHKSKRSRCGDIRDEMADNVELGLITNRNRRAFRIINNA
jgi:hypothetical protein